MSFACGWHEKEPGKPPELVAGQRADVARKLRITDASVRLARAMAYYGQRLDGWTDSEIGKYWGRSRSYINVEINALSVPARAEVKRKRIRSIRAEHALVERDAVDA
jgi:hypothetical protein